MGRSVWFGVFLIKAAGKRGQGERSDNRRRGRDNGFRDSKNKTLKINNVGKFMRKH
jgi:hypothetical protein